MSGGHETEPEQSMNGSRARRDSRRARGLTRRGAEARALTVSRAAGFVAPERTGPDRAGRWVQFVLVVVYGDEDEHRRRPRFAPARTHCDCTEAARQTSSVCACALAAPSRPPGSPQCGSSLGLRADVGPNGYLQLSSEPSLDRGPDPAEFCWADGTRIGFVAP